MGVSALRAHNLGKLVLICLIAFAAAGAACAQTIGILGPVEQLSSFEIAWNESVQPISGDASTSEFAPMPFSSLIKPNVPDLPSSPVQGSYVPLNGEERWHNFWNDTLLSPLSYVGALGGAYGQQLGDQPKEWGNSFAAYTKRVGSNLAQFGSQEAIHQGGAALMHTDPRYLSCRCKGGMQRTWYALKMSFLTYKEDGDKTVDIPQIAGAYGGAIISDVPNPSRYSPFLQGVRGGNLQIGANVAINLFREFSPELNRLNPFRRRIEAK